MIVHHIVKHERPVYKAPRTTAKGRFDGKHGSDEHRLFILNRAYVNCDFREGEEVKFRGNQYKINSIYGSDYIQWIEWEGLSPKFVELEDLEGEILYVNPGQLKKLSLSRRK